jgi:hypothetical protein
MGLPNISHRNRPSHIQFVLPKSYVLRPLTHYQVDLIPDEHTYYQADLTGGPDQVYLSGLPDNEWLA